MKLFRPLCALPPRVLKIIASPRQRRHHTELFRSEDCFSNSSVCVAGANFWKLSERSLEDEALQVEDHHVVRRRRTWKRDSYFGRWNSEEAVLLQTQGREAAITFGKSASGAGRFIGTLSGGSARTRDQSDICRSVSWAENKCSCVKGGNTDVAALLMERRH